MCWADGPILCEEYRHYYHRASSPQLLHSLMSIKYFLLTILKMKGKYRVAQKQRALDNVALTGVARKEWAKLGKAITKTEGHPKICQLSLLITFD